MLPRTPLYRYLGLFFALVFVWYYGPSLTGSPLSDLRGGTPTSPFNGGSDQLSWVKEVLKKHNVGPEISYAARTLKYIPDAKERLSMTEVDQDLFPENFTDIKVDEKTSLPLGTKLNVHVPEVLRPSAADASSLIFGVSTTFKRFTSEDTSPVAEWTRWLTDGKGNSNGAGLILALFNTTDVEIGHAADRLAIAGINATVVASNPSLDMAGRYVDLVQMLYNHPTAKQRKYFSLIDDDTFFPFMNELLRTLSKYNPAKPYYIGTFTERVDWILSNTVPMAYGGGGIFLTAPVASELVKAPCLQKNAEGAYLVGGDQGDRVLYNCIHQHTDFVMTYLPLLSQEDEFGDPAGFYESGRKHLSLHHYKSWHHTHIAALHTVADACGEDCVMQRFQFKDNFILSNGYSVAQYPRGIDFDVDHMESTFDYPQGKEGVIHSYAFGEMRKKLTRTGRKRAWEIVEARTEKEGRVQQVYVKRAADERWVGEGEERPALDSVVVLTWIP
ncbi:hypothetical protein LSUE1_G006598 [Lachnellula suecica]|uniref:Glycosyltransferase family 31 protein n=1 Tax=Lachnellula suecica TaxID=602035 RepID=A0A8T9C484_9HELO|nr:hypothetical protein LSUE1_G006598 [Lachnellula suecica]